jgi:hypothetical protein
MKARTHNSTLAIGGVSCSADSFVVAESSVLRINISGKKARPSQICKTLCGILENDRPAEKNGIQKLYR